MLFGISVLFFQMVPSSVFPLDIFFLLVVIAGTRGLQGAQRHRVLRFGSIPRVAGRFAVSSTSKEAFYRERAKTYPFEDPEALIRYRRTIDWMNLDGPLSIREVGCKFSVIFDLLKSTGRAFDYRALDIDLETFIEKPAHGA